jgi:hypothetical protein
MIKVKTVEYQLRSYEKEFLHMKRLSTFNMDKGETPRKTLRFDTNKI